MLFHLIINAVTLVSADNVTKSLADSTLSLKDLVNISISIYSALVGAVVASILLFAHERAKDKREIKKIRSLLNSDFSALYDLMMKDRERIKKEYKKLNDDELANSIMSTSLSISDFYHDYGNYYDLEFWDAIVSSGSLLKLEKEEIRGAQSVYNSLNWYNKSIRELQDGAGDQLEGLLEEVMESENGPDAEEITELLSDYFKSILGWLEDCISDIENLKRFSWINLKTRD